MFVHDQLNELISRSQLDVVRMDLCACYLLDPSAPCHILVGERGNCIKPG